MKGNLLMTQWNWNRIGLFDINFDTGEAYWSRELRRILDVPDNVPADFELLLRRVHPDDRREFAASAARTYQPDCPSYRSIEPRIVRSNGEVQRIHIDAAAVLRDGRSGDAVRLVGLVIEVALVSSRTNDLADANARASYRRRSFHRSTPLPAFLPAL
jgi:hypothetical protein